MMPMVAGRRGPTGRASPTEAVDRRLVEQQNGTRPPLGRSSRPTRRKTLPACRAWTMARLLGLLLAHRELGARLVLDLDDTLSHKRGRKVDGAGSFRDPIRPHGQDTMFAQGLEPGRARGPEAPIGLRP